MSTYSEDLLSLLEQAAERFVPPAVDYLHLPSASPDNSRPSKFGVIGLADGSLGFFYTRSAAGEDGAPTSFDASAVVKKNALEIARGYLRQDPMARAIGLGAANALSQSLFRRAGYRPTGNADSLAGLAINGDDRVGMVGFFPPLVALISELGIPLTVIEKDAAFLKERGRFSVTLDPSHLARCNKVLCTASTLLNGTLDDVLASCDPNAKVALIGPSAGAFPDPLFRRGVDMVGSSVATDVAALKQRLAAGLPWRGVVGKYAIAKDDYPGFGALLTALNADS